MANVHWIALSVLSVPTVVSGTVTLGTVVLAVLPVPAAEDFFHFLCMRYV